MEQNSSENELRNLKELVEEYKIILRQSDILPARYHVPTRTMIFPPETAKAFGVDPIYPDFPDTYIKTGAVVGNIEQFAEFYNAICRGEPSGRNSTEMRIASGEIRLFNRRFTTICDSEGKPLHGIISLIDITEEREQKLACEKWFYLSKSLKADNIHYYDYNMTQDILEAIDGNSPSIYPDQNEKTFTGVARYVAENIIHPEEREEYLRIFSVKNLLERFRNGETETITEHRRLGKDGKYFHAQGVVQLYADPFNGDVLSFVVIKNMEDSIAQWKSKLHAEARDALNNSMPGGIIFAYNEPGYPFYSVNDGLLDYLGFPDSQALQAASFGKSLNFVHPEDCSRVEREISNVLKIGEQYQVEHRVLTGDGAVRWVVHRGRKSVDHEGRDIILIVYTDVTEVVKLQEELKANQIALEKAAAAAEEATRMKSVFLANMSHEIRTPMNGVVGFAELALDDENLSDRTRGYLNKIKVSGAGLLEIINDILDISKIEAGKMEMEKTEFSLHEVFKQCETISGIKAEEKGVLLYFYSEPYVWKKLLGDPTKLRQVLLNLLSNAIKFTNRGMVKLTALLEEQSENHVRIHFEVKDSGIGMSSEQLEKIFDPFTQADSSTTRRFGGTGLGLPITRSMIELMGGELKVESAVGLGSKFSFSLLFETVNIPATQPGEAAFLHRDVQKPSFSGEVLVCEDNPINQDVICDHLSKVGLRSVVAPNGKVGLDKVKTRMIEGKPFDLILMDVHMPIMDGLEATKNIIRLGVDTPIIALTANAMEKDRNTYLASGMSDYVAKPFRAPELWTSLLKFLTPISLDPVFESTNQEDSRDSTSETEPEPEGGLINRKLGLERAANDKMLYERVRKNFSKSNRSTFEQMETNLKTGNILQAHQIAHTLKGTAGLLGAASLSQAAFLVEEALQDGTVENLKDRILRDLKDELDAVLNELDRADSTENTQETAEKGGEGLEDAGVPDRSEQIRFLEELKPLLESSNSKSSDYLDRIETVLASFAEDAKLLAQQIDDYDFDFALKTLDEIRGKMGS